MEFVKTTKAAWELANKMFPTDYIKNERASLHAGYDIYESTDPGNGSWISDLGERLELNIVKDGRTESTNIWIDSDEQDEHEEKVLSYIRELIQEIAAEELGSIAYRKGVEKIMASKEMAEAILGKKISVKMNGTVTTVPEA